MPDLPQAARVPASAATVVPDEVLRAEADERAHDRLTPDAMLDAAAAVELYVEAFVAGACFATALGARS